ncbi:MAG: choice-of-anchor D domain-containing protein, partial [Deltaproteobacteria bacterium]
MGGEMKRIIWAVLSLFLSSIFWVNGWSQPLPGPDFSPPLDWSQSLAKTPGPPKISVSPTSVRFGNVYVGSALERTLIIKNSGKSDLEIGSIEIAGVSASEFGETDDCFTIPAGGSCTVTVTFAPESTGKKTGTMAFTSNDPRKPIVNVKLSGNAKPSPCAYSLSASSGEFDASGGEGSINVTSPAGCNWTAKSNNPDWIVITSGGSGSGNGTVAYSVAVNTGDSPRTGTMTIAGQTFTVTQSETEPGPPIYPLSEYQEALIASYGYPDYLAVVFNSNPERREETWVYADLQKTYIFWDGMILDEKSITVDPNAYWNPPYLDPSIFTKETTLSDLVELLESDYTEVDQSILKDVIGDANFKTYHFNDAGLFVAFLDGSLAAVQTIDIPESDQSASSGRLWSLPKVQAGGPDAVGLNSLTFEGRVNLLLVEVLAYETAGVDFRQDPSYPDLKNCIGEDWEECVAQVYLKMLKNAAKHLQGTAV